MFRIKGGHTDVVRGGGGPVGLSGSDPSVDWNRPECLIGTDPNASRSTPKPPGNRVEVRGRSREDFRRFWMVIRRASGDVNPMDRIRTDRDPWTSPDASVFRRCLFWAVRVWHERRGSPRLQLSLLRFSRRTGHHAPRFLPPWQRRLKMRMSASRGSNLSLSPIRCNSVCLSGGGWQVHTQPWLWLQPFLPSCLTPRLK